MEPLRDDKGPGLAIGSTAGGIMGTPTPGLSPQEGHCECAFIGMGGKGLADPRLLIGIDFGAINNGGDRLSLVNPV